MIYGGEVELNRTHKPLLVPGEKSHLLGTKASANGGIINLPVCPGGARVLLFLFDQTEYRVQSTLVRQEGPADLAEELHSTVLYNWPDGKAPHRNS